jgi:virginiamycin B lyase
MRKWWQRVKKGGSKRLRIFVLIGIVVISIEAVVGFMVNNTNDKAPVNDASPGDSKMQFEQRFCGESVARIEAYVREFKIPAFCSLPLGIVIDRDDNVWFASTRQGNIVKFNPRIQEFREFQIPQWPPREAGLGASQVWSLKFDQEGNLWFTDEKQNAIWRFFPLTERFEKYVIPSVGNNNNNNNSTTIYPIDIGFDLEGNVYIVGIRSKDLWTANKSALRDGTSEGFSNIPMPTQGFSSIDPDLVTVGSLEIDNDNKDVWISLLAFNQMGQLLRFDIETKKFNIFELPDEIKSPVGFVLDKAGNVWVTDQGTSIFFKLDPATKKITQYSTSVLSPRVNGGKQLNNSYTLPYWLVSDSNGSIWFNEHIGNKIARFDPESETLVEYWIPTQNRKFAQCQEIPSNKDCGIANALQLAVDSIGNAWFTEWTENKIGTVNGAMAVPFSIEPSQNAITIQQGRSNQIDINISLVNNKATTPQLPLQLIVSGTFTRNGSLDNNIAALFSEDTLTFAMGESSKRATLLLNLSEDTKPGEYTLMVGAEYEDITYNKAIRVTVI